MTALDPARQMLETLRGKMAGARIGVVAAQGAWLPFPEACFDAVVLARIMYVIADWRDVLREAARVLRPDGRVLHEWGNGSGEEVWVQIREHARALFEGAGVANPFHPGARREADVDHVLAGHGLAVSDEVRAEPDRQMTLAQFLASIASGECSYVWNVPADVQERCLPELSRWAAGRFDLEARFPRELVWKVYRRETHTSS